MAPKGVIEIAVSRRGRRLVLEWSCEATDEDGEHKVNLADVESAARRVRGELKNLATEIKRYDGEQSATRAVARAGRCLYHQLVPEGVELRGLLDSSRKLDLHIHINNFELLLPWGATYSGTLPEDGEETDLDFFWCIKHNVVAYPPSARTLFDNRSSATNDWLRISYVPQGHDRPSGSHSCDNSNCFENTCKQLRAWTWALYLRDADPQSSVGLLFLDTIRRHGGRFVELPRRWASRSKLAGIVFVDGVDVRIDEPAGTEIFREVWRNWQGMVVNEVPIPTTKQLNFCVELVNKIESGEKISELVRVARQDWKIESLLYGIYCLPEFSFQKWVRA